MRHTAADFLLWPPAGVGWMLTSERRGEVAMAVRHLVRGFGVTLGVVALSVGWGVGSAGVAPAGPPAVTPAADLRIAGRSDELVHVPGPQATFSFTLTNDGPDPAAAPVVTMSLPAGVPFWPGEYYQAPISMGLEGRAPTPCTGGGGSGQWTCRINGEGGQPVDLPSGAGAWFFTYLDVSALPLGTVAEVGASVATTTLDPDVSDNAVTVPYTVVPWADLAVAQRPGTPTASATDGVVRFELSFDVVNRGPHPAGEPTFVVALVGSATRLHVTARIDGVTPPPTCTTTTEAPGGPGVGGTTVTCPLGPALAPTGSRPIVARLAVTVARAAWTTEVFGAAFLRTTTPDPVPDYPATFTLTVTPEGIAGTTGETVPTTVPPTAQLPATGPWSAAPLGAGVAAVVLGVALVATARRRGPSVPWLRR
jgi:uncharacterized repeat protein (TIGR01451 family)